MYAVIETGGKQYKVKKGSTIFVEKLGVDEGSKVEFDKVLLLAGDGDPVIGEPYVENAVVEAKLVADIKDKKVIVFKFKRKTGYRRKKGHRQQLSQVVIENIKAAGKKTAKKAVKAEAEKVEKEA